MTDKLSDSELSVLLSQDAARLSVVIEDVEERLRRIKSIAQRLDLHVRERRAFVREMFQDAALLESATKLEAAFRAGFNAGFDVSREGFNSECPYGHLAPSPHDAADDPLQSAEDTAWRTFCDPLALTTKDH